MSSIGPFPPPHIKRLMSPEDRKRYDAKAERALARRETEEQRIFNNWLNSRMAENLLYAINPRSDKASTIRVGHPDYTIFLPHQMVLIEMKVPGGRLSEEQMQVIELLRHLGYRVQIAWSADEAIEMTERFL